jgi:hypothetical protein
MFCRISAALRQASNGGCDFVGFLVVRNEHHRRDASLFSIAVQFPKLARALTAAILPTPANFVHGRRKTSEMLCRIFAPSIPCRFLNAFS